MHPMVSHETTPFSPLVLHSTALHHSSRAAFRDLNTSAESKFNPGQFGKTLLLVRSKASGPGVSMSDKGTTCCAWCILVLDFPSASHGVGAKILADSAALADT